MNNKKVIKFLKEQGFVDHPEQVEKMILKFSEKGGLIVYEYDSSYELSLGYLPNEIEPELIFSDLNAKSLVDNFQTMKTIASELFARLLVAGF